MPRQRLPLLRRSRVGRRRNIPAGVDFRRRHPRFPLRLWPATKIVLRLLHAQSGELLLGRLPVHHPVVHFQAGLILRHVTLLRLVIQSPKPRFLVPIAKSGRPCRPGSIVGHFRERLVALNGSPWLRTPQITQPRWPGFPVVSRPIPPRLLLAHLEPLADEGAD